MEGKRARAIIVLTGAAAMIVAAGCTPAGSSGQGGGSELVKSKCTLCHTIDRVNSAKKDKAGWEQTIGRMRAKGAQMSDAEAAQIAEYLSSQK